MYIVEADTQISNYKLNVDNSQTCLREDYS